MLFLSFRLATNEYLESLLVDVCHTFQLEELSFKIPQYLTILLSLTIVRCEQIKVETVKSALIQIVRHQLNLKELVIHTQT